jgi:hypothetical protein
VDFKFTFELSLNFSICALFASCKETSNFLIQVRLSNFTSLKAMSINIFGEIMEFFAKGLDPSKFKPNSHVVEFLNF